MGVRPWAPMPPSTWSLNLSGTRFEKLMSSDPYRAPLHVTKPKSSQISPMVELQCYSIHLPGQPGKNRGSTRRSGYVSWGSEAVYVTDSSKSVKRTEVKWSYFIQKTKNKKKKKTKKKKLQVGFLKRWPAAAILKIVEDALTGCQTGCTWPDCCADNGWLAQTAHRALNVRSDSASLQATTIWTVQLLKWDGIVKS